VRRADSLSVTTIEQFDLWVTGSNLSHYRSSAIGRAIVNHQYRATRYYLNDLMTEQGDVVTFLVSGNYYKQRLARGDKFASRHWLLFTVSFGSGKTSAFPLKIGDSSKNLQKSHARISK